MKNLLIFDHFLARGGAENVSLLIKEQVREVSLETAFADPILFQQEINTGMLINHNCNYRDSVFPTLKLCCYYLFRFAVKKDVVNLILTGVFAPLILCFSGSKQRSIVYFHTFPSFINESFGSLRKQYGIPGAFLFKCFVVFYLYFLRKSVNKADRVLANSKSVQMRFSKLKIDTHVLYPPVAVDQFKPGKSLGYFLSTARLESNKRIEEVLKAFRELPEYHIKVAGGGALENSLRNEFSGCSNIEFLGWCTPDQVIDLYAHCQCLIYIPKNEYFGIAPVEANAAGKFVIGIDEGGLSETLTDESLGCLLKTPFDFDELKYKITSYADTSVENQNTISYRQLQAARFSKEAFLEQLQSYLLIQ